MELEGLKAFCKWGAGLRWCDMEGDIPKMKAWQVPGGAVGKLGSSRPVYLSGLNDLIKYSHRCV